MHDFIKISSNQYPNKFPTNCIHNHLFTPAQPSYTGQTGPPKPAVIPVRPVPPTGQTGLTQSKPRNLGAAKIAHQLQIPSRI